MLVNSVRPAVFPEMMGVEEEKSPSQQTADTVCPDSATA